MTESKKQPQSKATKPAPEKSGALSEATLNKVTGGNMPTAVERGSGRG